MIGRNVLIAIGLLLVAIPIYLRATNKLHTELDWLMAFAAFPTLATVMFIAAYQNHKEVAKERKLNQIDGLIEEENWQQAFKDCPQYINVEARIFLKQHYDIQPKSKTI